MKQHLMPLDDHEAKIEKFFEASLKLINSFEKEFDRQRFVLADKTIVSLRDLQKKYRIHYPNLRDDYMSSIVPGLSQEDLDWIIEFQANYDIVDRAFLRFGKVVRMMEVSDSHEIEV
jgi:hypothetical protein